MTTNANAARLAREAIRDFLIGLAVFGGLFLVLGAEPTGAAFFDTSWFGHPAHTFTQPHLSGPMAVAPAEQVRAALEQTYVSPIGRLGSDRLLVLGALALAFAAAFAFNLGLWRHLCRSPAKRIRRTYR